MRLTDGRQCGAEGGGGDDSREGVGGGTSEESAPCGSGHACTHLDRKKRKAFSSFSFFAAGLPAHGRVVRYRCGLGVPRQLAEAGPLQSGLAAAWRAFLQRPCVSVFLPFSQLPFSPFL